ncbi:hypothetical protein FDT66_02340 [Polaribacter aestuariivivens]|uniref:Glutaminyl-tRNA synthetase n=1 Tax=Polaribacter aestuariivivens TaxID=2304626 RepID=A0A5S3NFM2_9FLAO|nr:DUF6327 family protein [Polaribacter aestuariivivens]TMM32326.1 hypothetical protein FDT66_02340 [Polaribacter aestuariivivens]
MKKYTNFSDIERDLKMLSLERQIALEELKIVKSDFVNQLKPLTMVGNFLKFASKYGLLILVKKIFK